MPRYDSDKDRKGFVLRTIQIKIVKDLCQVDRTLASEHISPTPTPHPPNSIIILNQHSSGLVASLSAVVGYAIASETDTIQRYFLSVDTRKEGEPGLHMSPTVAETGEGLESGRRRHVYCEHWPTLGDQLFFCFVFKGGKFTHSLHFMSAFCFSFFSLFVVVVLVVLATQALFSD